MNKVNTLMLKNSSYPDNLRHIPSPPKQLYWTGVDPKEWLGLPKVAIVGSRKATAYGLEVTKRLSGELASHGVVIISGLAYGIDYMAHKAALDANGLTVAVLPTGLDTVYPAAHQNIAKQICEHGALISEYPKGAISYKQNFIARNRIVSGLCDVLLITEAAANSGSLHTASFALEQGKTVMAVPGNINSPSSQGTNNLIKSGALPATNLEDIFFALGITPKKIKASRTFRGTPEQELVFRLIKEGVQDQETLTSKAKLDGPAVMGALTILELSGFIRPAGNGHWILI